MNAFDMPEIMSLDDDDMCDVMPDMVQWHGEGECPIADGVPHIVITGGCGVRDSGDDQYKHFIWAWSQSDCKPYRVIGYVILSDIPKWARDTERTAYYSQYHMGGVVFNDCGRKEIYKTIYHQQFPWGSTRPKTKEDFYRRFGGESREFNGRTDGTIMLLRY